MRFRRPDKATFAERHTRNHRAHPDSWGSLCAQQSKAKELFRNFRRGPNRGLQRATRSRGRLTRPCGLAPAEEPPGTEESPAHLSTFGDTANPNSHSRSQNVATDGSPS